MPPRRPRLLLSTIVTFIVPRAFLVRRALLTGFVLLLAPFGAACGGSQASDLYSSASTTGGGAMPDASGDASVPVEASADTGAPGSNEAAADAMPLPDVAVPEAGPPPSTAIACGSATCQMPSEFCCAFNAPRTTADICSSSLGDCSMQGGTAVTCTSTTQCPSGQVCCATTNSMNIYSDVSCRTTCPTTSGNARQFCDPNITSDCPSAAECDPSTLLVGFHVCLLN
jgi:hypothetical protein